MSRFSIAIAVLIIVDFIIPGAVEADGALKYAEISKGINPNRRRDIPGTIEREYSWKFENQDYTALMAIDTKWYNRTRSHERRDKRQRDLDYLPPIVSEGTQALQDLVRAFNRIIPQTWNATRRVNFVLSFVHTLPYTKDITTGYDDYYKYATETLVEGGGDCEDTSILFASILRGLDFEVALISPPRHLAIGVKGNFRGTFYRYKSSKYYYCETTGTGWRLGELPPETGSSTIMPITRSPIKPIPVEPITHVSPSEVSIGETIPLTLDLISSKGPQQLRIYYTIYDKDSKELGQYNQKMRLSPQYPESSTKVYDVDLPPQRRVGSIKYYIEFKYGSQVFRDPREQSRYYQIFIVDEKPPTISVLSPDDGEQFTADQQITVRTEVMDNSVVEEVYIYFLSPIDRSHKLLKEESSGNYAIETSFSRPGSIEYYLTATDEAGNKSQSEPRRIYISRHAMLDKGIKLYEQARYSEAIGALTSAIREIEDLEQQAEIYLYLGGAKRGSGASNDEVKEEFRKAVRLNPTQELPKRVGDDHPVFAELLEEVRMELIGESIIVEHVPPSRVSVGERIPVTLKLNSPLGPQQVKIYYTIYDKDSNELARNNQEMRLSDQQSASSAWIYKVELPPQKRIGLIEYYITLEYDNGMAFKYPRAQSRYYQIFIVDEKPPTITLLYPPENAPFTVDQQTNVRAEVIDNSIVKEVRINYTNQSQKLFKEESSDMYTIDVTFKGTGSAEYYLTAIDEAGNESRSESRRIRIIGGPPKIHIMKPYNGTTFRVHQRITIEAKVTDYISIKQVRLFYSFSIDDLSEPLHYSDRSVTEISSDTYIGDIPPQSEAGYIRYYLTVTDEEGNESRSERRHVRIIEIPTGGVENGNGSKDPREEITTNENGNGGDGGAPGPRITGNGNGGRSPTYPIYQGIWISVGANNVFAADGDGSYTFRLAYLREGRTQPTLGAQLDFSPDRRDVSAMVQWGPRPLGKSKGTFTLLGGIATYEESPRSTHTTPLIGAGLKLYPWDNIVIDAVSSIQFLPDLGTADLYHYEVGIRYYVTPELGLRVGGGQQFLGDENVTTVQIGIGVSF